MEQLDLFKPRMERLKGDIEQPATMVAPTPSECPTEAPMDFNDKSDWISNNGIAPQFMLRGGMIDVKFNCGDIVHGVTEGNGRGLSNGNWNVDTWDVMDHPNGVAAWRPSIFQFVHAAIGEALDSKCDGDIRVSVERTYTLNIKGHVITLNDEEVEDLISKLEDVE